MGRQQASAPALDQITLQQLVIELARRGCYVVVSDSTANEIAALYESDQTARRVGLHAIRVPARGAINSNASRRGPIDEFLITNVGQAPATQTS